MSYDGRGPWGWGCGRSRDQRKAAREAHKAAHEEWKAGLKQAKRAWKHWKRAGEQWDSAWQPGTEHRGGPWGPAAEAGPGPYAPPPPYPDAGYQPSSRTARVLHGLRRDTERGKVAGVCAGLARYYGVNKTLIRLAAVFALFMNPPLTLLAYALAAYFIPRDDLEAVQPAHAAPAPSPDPEPQGLPPELNFTSLREKFRDLELRAAEMEREVTSPEFRLRRELNRMGQA